MTTIPLRSLAEYTLEVTLGDQPYLLTVKWNTRAAHYTLDIATRDGTALVSGLGLLLNSELLRNHAGLGLPSGALMLIDAANVFTDVGFDDLEERTALVYLTEAEYAAI
jgi:hypothetical protein